MFVKVRTKLCILTIVTINRINLEKTAIPFCIPLLRKLCL